MPTTASARVLRTCAVVVALALAVVSGVTPAAAQRGASRAPAEAAGIRAAKQDRPGNAEMRNGNGHVLPGRYVVELAAGADDVDVAADYGNSMRVMRRYRRAMNGFAAAMSAEVAQRLRDDPRVAAVEADVEIALSRAQSNPVWGLDRLDQRRRPLDDYYNYDAAGRGVTVYVVDTGVYARHHQFGSRVLRGFDATGEGSAGDCVGHGTHVAGIVAGRTYGVAKSAVIRPVRVLNCHGSGTKSQLIDGLDWIVRHHRRSAPAVANLSLGGPASRVVDRAIARVLDDKVTVVAAAGNESDNACYYSPARVPAVITVGATDLWDEAPYWSNYGPCLDLFAPGVSIRSAGTWSRSAALAADGTSMASPFVAGAAAVFLSQHRSAAPRTVASALRSRATPKIVGYAGYNTTEKLLHMPSHVPTVLAAGVSRGLIAKGDEIQVRAVLRNALTGAGLGNQVVRIDRRTKGTSVWHYLASRRTDASGRASITQQPLRPTQYRVRHPRSASTQARVSRTVETVVSGKWATTLGIGTSATDVTYGDPLTIAGTLRRSYNGTPLRDIRVELQQRAAGAGSWSAAAVSRTNADGLARFAGVVPRRNTAYRLRFGGNSLAEPALSTLRTISVGFLVDATLSATSGVIRQDAIDLNGRVQPLAQDPSDRVVVIEYRESWYSYWERLATVAYDDNGDFTRRVDSLLCCADLYHFRVRAAGDGYNAETVTDRLSARLTW